ncbi:alpha-beta hydrolase superfamily lysophospholipase [Kitasatospora sp. MAA19]|uniref:alpha/beta hydrolase family protein n=1 Tax=Kitasatospora sp. MAA19 TaxID=3035090 RepID=UPI002475FB1E|nr:alpha/beta fold hydrolase [Kitasatospora sp. MAA19]MDH6703850.1 alpha-beta hydrolase superfamily lysophospholipase [Kitasatospora sp. MAA19]
MSDTPDLSFLDAPGLLAAFVEENRPRAHGAGLDPYEYTRVTAPLTSLRDWPAACRAAGHRYTEAADRAAAEGRTVTAGSSHRAAARWFHAAGLLPHPDRAAAARTAAEADGAMRRALALLDPDAERVEGEGFAGWLRRPATAAGGRFPVVVVVPGMDSGKEEFHAVAEALLARGLAVLAIDGPGQGVLATTSAPEPDYHRVVGRALDALDALDALGAGSRLDLARTAVIGLSLGGYYAATAAAHEPRIRAAALVSGPYRLDWDALVPFVTATLAQRCGGLDAARAFVRRVDLTALAPAITTPLLVVEGGEDRIPGVTSATALVEQAPDAELLLVPHGNHLLGTALPDWLPATADWLTTRLTGHGTPGPGSPGGVGADRRRAVREPV